MVSLQVQAQIKEKGFDKKYSPNQLVDFEAHLASFEGRNLSKASRDQHLLYVGRFLKYVDPNSMNYLQVKDWTTVKKYLLDVASQVRLLGPSALIAIISSIKELCSFVKER